MRPDDIPQDVWETAQHAARTIPDLDAETKIARVIMAERERCAKIADLYAHRDTGRIIADFIRDAKP